MEGEWLKKKTAQKLRSEPIAITLSYRQPERPIAPVIKRPPRIRERPIYIKRNTPKKVTKIKPEKKSRVTTKKTDIKKITTIKPIKSPVMPEKKVIPEKKEIPPKPEEITKPEIPLESIPPLESEPLITPPLEPGPILKQKGPEMLEKEIDLVPAPMKEENQGPVLQGVEEKATETPPLPIQEAIPIYKKNPSPKYPRIARRRGHQGTVILEVLVNRNGWVGELRLFRSSGYSSLDRAALASVEKWLFEPGSRGDEKVDMWIKVPIRFKLK